MSVEFDEYGRKVGSPMVQRVAKTCMAAFRAEENGASYCMEKNNNLTDGTLRMPSVLIALQALLTKLGLICIAIKGLRLCLIPPVPCAS